jgi:hypothetical protein
MKFDGVKAGKGLEGTGEKAIEIPIEEPDAPQIGEGTDEVAEILVVVFVVGNAIIARIRNDGVTLVDCDLVNMFERKEKEGRAIRIIRFICTIIRFILIHIIFCQYVVGLPHQAEDSIVGTGRSLR